MTEDNPHTYGQGTRLSSLYTIGRDGKPCPKYTERDSVGRKAWERGHNEWKAESKKPLAKVHPLDPLPIAAPTADGQGRRGGDQVNKADQAITQNLERAKQEKRLSKRITARKFGGDDLYSWAVFLDGRPAYTGLGRNSVRYYKSLVLEMLKEKEGAK